MKTLYLLTEDDTDDLFYLSCAEKIACQVFTPVSRRMRKGTGLGAVRASLKLALQEISRMQVGSGVHFLIAMDNDRAPHALAADAVPVSQRARLSKADSHKSDRYAGLLAALDASLGGDRSKWQIPVAIAIPVEMIESWLLLIARGGEAHDLPRFARQDSPSAHHYHQGVPPPQLKDRRDLIHVEDGFDGKNDWVLHLVFNKLDPADLAQRSPSFELFKQWLDAWPKASGTN